MLGSLKSAARLAASTPFVGRLIWQLQRGRDAIVMMHRFAVPGMLHVGHEPTELHGLLEYLRACNVEFVRAEDLVQRAIVGRHGAFRRPAVAFTVDDGYFDVSTVGAPVFRAFDCPWTLFVVPDAVDEKCVFWWDQLAWMRQARPRGCWTVRLPNYEFSVQWENELEGYRTQKYLEERFKTLHPDILSSILQDLSSQCDVPLLTRAPVEYSVLKWSELRSLAAQGVSVGAHSMTHPILRRCDDEQAEWEIQASIRRVGQEVSNPSSLFCYPNGRSADFGAREIQTLSASGLVGALTSEHGLVRAVDSGDVDTWRWRIPRISYDGRPGAFFGAFV